MLMLKVIYSKSLECFQLKTKCSFEQQEKLGQTVSLPVAIGTPSLCQVIDGLGKP